jgi:hypothetical protein
MDSAAPTVEVKGVTYQIGRLTPKKAFHVSRRLAPFLGAILPHVNKLMGSKEKNALDRMATVLPAIAELAAAMPNDDVDFIIDTCLSVVHMRQDRGWMPIQANGQIMFDYIDMMVMLQLTAEVVKVNLIDFFPTSLQTEYAGTATRTQ